MKNAHSKTKISGLENKKIEYRRFSFFDFTWWLERTKTIDVDIYIEIDKPIGDIYVNGRVLDIN